MVIRKAKLFRQSVGIIRQMEITEPALKIEALQEINGE